MSVSAPHTHFEKALFIGSVGFCTYQAYTMVNGDTHPDTPSLFKTFGVLAGAFTGIAVYGMVKYTIDMVRF